MRPRAQIPVALAGVSGALALVAGCGASGSGSAGGGSLVLYNGQRPATTQALATAFTKATGIKVLIRSGSDPQLAQQIEQEGGHSPADVFFAEDSPALTALSEKKQIAPAPAAALKAVPAEDSSARKDWVGVAGRETDLEYNPGKVPASSLPASLLDLASPAWKGKVAVAPASADFQSQVTAVIQAEGTAKARTWLEGIKRNAQIYQNNNAILQAVNRGQVASGIVFHASWFRATAESADQTSHVRIHYFGHRDPGAFLAVSGAGILRSAPHKAAADRFVTWLTSVAGQNELATVQDFEYPLNPSATPAPQLKPPSQLDVPDIPADKLADTTPAQQLLQHVGLI
jgi:iron(III) transport system substrate-binding protein